MKNFAALKDAAVKELNIADLPQEAQQEILALVGENALKATVLALLSRIPQEMHEEFARKMDSGDEGEMDSFLRRYVPDLDIFVDAEVKKVVDEFKALRDRA